MPDIRLIAHQLFLGPHRAEQAAVSIRTRLLLLLLSVLLPAVVAALWLLSETYSDERRAHERLLSDSSRALALVVDRELAQRAFMARALSLSRWLDGAPELSPEALASFELEARRTMLGLDGWIELRSPERVLLDTRAPTGRQAPSTPQLRSAPLSERPLVLPLVLPPAAPAHAGLVQPVQRDNKTVLNLTLTLLPSELQRIVDQQRLPADWVGAVLDKQGTVVARHPGGVRYAGRQATPDVRARLATATEGLLASTTLDGVQVMSYFATSSQGWTYITGMPREQFDGLLPNAVVRVVIGVLGLLGLAVLGAQWVARGIAQPVGQLKDAAARLQAGQSVLPGRTGVAEFDAVLQALATASDALRHVQSDLQHEVADAVERTRRAEQQLSHNQRVEALGRLTGGLAHDYNNLLGVISNSAHLIQRHATSPELQLPVQATLRAVEAGSRLTQHLLRFAGRQPLQARAVDLASYLPELQELIKTVLGKRIEVTVQVANRTRAVTVDPSELELSIINLALNARDAMPTGGHWWLRAANAEAVDSAGLPAGDYVVLAISDDGPGMEESLAERVFEPFFSTKSVGQGSGLGLSQVHGFCVQAGGLARLASTPGLGTTVSLVLPAAALNPPDTLAPQPAPAQPGVHGKRLLLVEDNLALGDVTAALLESYGALVERAASPEQALQRLGSGVQQVQPIEVVLSDVVMPGPMDGFALARSLRQKLPHLPVVLISGYSGATVDPHEFVLLRKPCAPADLLAALGRALISAKAG